MVRNIHGSFFPVAHTCTPLALSSQSCTISITIIWIHTMVWLFAFCVCVLVRVRVRVLTTKNRPFNFCIWKIFTYSTYILTPICTVRSRNFQAIHYFYHASRAPYARHTPEKNGINEFKTGFSLLIWMQSISIKDICLSGETTTEPKKCELFLCRTQNAEEEVLNRQSKAKQCK